MSRVERDPERGRAAAVKLKALGVKGKLIEAAVEGYITEVACGMPKCFCPEELGGAGYFAPRANQWNDWEATFEHYPIPKVDGGRRTIDNAVLAHRLCNKLDHSIRNGLSIEKDLARVRKAREAIRRNNVQIGMTEGGEPVEETEPETDAATPKPTKKAPEWKSRPDAEKAQYLLDHQTLSDRTWTDELRLKGEKRDAFVRRILLGHVLHGEAVGADETETA
jgi:hypothetical protein